MGGKLRCQFCGYLRDADQFTERRIGMCGPDFRHPAEAMEALLGICPDVDFVARARRTRGQNQVLVARGEHHVERTRLIDDV